MKTKQQQNTFFVQVEKKKLISKLNFAKKKK